MFSTVCCADESRLDQFKRWSRREDVQTAIGRIAFVGGSLYLIHTVYGWRTQIAEAFIGLFKQSGPFGDIEVFGSACRGKIVDIDGLQLYQYDVKNQLDYDGGGYASCGYQALKNGIAFIRISLGETKSFADELMASSHIKELFGTGEDPGRWRRAVIARRPRRDTGEWLMSHELDNLIEAEKAAHRLLPIDDGSYGISTLDAPEIFGMTLLPVDPSEVKDPLRPVETKAADHMYEAATHEDADRIALSVVESTRAKTPYSHALIINLAQQNRASADTRSHFIFLGVHVDARGNRSYHCADSLGTDRTQNYVVRHCIDVLEDKILEHEAFDAE